MLHRLLLPFSALVVASLPAFAGNAIFEAFGTVSSGSAPSGPFAGVAPGQSAHLVFEVVTPGTDVAPGQYTNYAIDLPTLAMTIGSASAGSNGTASDVGMANAFPVADGVHLFGAPLAGGQTVQFEFSECTGTIFTSTDPLQNTGTWPASLFCSYTWQVSGSGVFLDIDVQSFKISVPVVGQPFCFGDGTAATACPCANSGLPGRGCENSAATGGALLQALGTTTPDTIVLTSSGELPTAPSIVLQGSQSLVSPVAFGDGLRCAAGTLKRLYVKAAVSGSVSAPAAGDPSITAQSAALGDPIASGSTRVYQTYYRDPNPTFCAAPAGNTWNVSSGLVLTW